MTEQELKEKIARIIAKYLCKNRYSHFQLYGDKANCYSRENFAECEVIADTVDALIAAGLTFEPMTFRIVENKPYSYTAGELANWKEDQECIAKLLHRAEVAERALKICLIDNLYCCDCDTRFYKKCKGTDKDKEECAMLDFNDYIQQAEKELAEEGKDD